MKIEVHLRDGRTAMRFAKRGDLLRALSLKPGNEENGISVEIMFHVDQVGWRKTKLRSINANSISYTVEVEVED